MQNNVDRQEGRDIFINDSNWLGLFLLYFLRKYFKGEYILHNMQRIVMNKIYKQHVTP